MDRPETLARRCRRRGATLLAALAALLAGGAAQAESVLRIVMNSDLKILDPIWNTDFVIRDHGYMVYDTLFATDADGEIRPQMVDRTEISADKLTYAFTLRDGLKWYDGQPVTADDCVASIKRWAARDATGQKLMTFFAEVVARDTRTLALRLKEPTGLVLPALGKPNSNVPLMMPRRVAESDPYTQIKDATADVDGEIAGPPQVLPEDERPRPAGLRQSDFAKSRSLLKEVGYDGTPIVLTQSSDLFWQTNLAPVAKRLMEQGGFKVDMQAMDWQSIVVPARARKRPSQAAGTPT
jgi:ABC-type transport system substrate-binding protein